MNNSNVRNSILLTLVFVFVLYYGYWIVVGLLSMQLSASLFMKLGLSPFASSVSTDIVIALIAGSIFGIPFGLIVKDKPTIFALIAALIAVMFVIIEYFPALSWLHYFSYLLMVAAVTVFSCIGSRLKKYLKIQSSATGVPPAAN